MDRQELLKERRLRPEVPQKMAAGAVNLCMGCPLANICPTKTPGECPPQLAKQAVEYSGDGGDYTSVKMSYLSELLDDSKPTVMANLIRKPAPPPKLTPKAALPIQPPVLLPRSTPPKVSNQLPKPRPNHLPTYPHEQLGEAIADIFYALLSVRSLKSITSKQSR